MSDDPKDFWDFTDLVPPRKKAPVGKGFPADTTAVEIHLPAPAEQTTGNAETWNAMRVGVVKENTPVAGPQADTPDSGRSQPLQGNIAGRSGVFADEDVPLRERPVNPYARKEPPKETPETTYRPEHSLIREVRIYPWRTTYNYYELFRAHAQKLHTREGHECAETDFFSYMPQYTQLAREQLRYYLWWRTNFRQGNYLHAAYSYLLLYLYEQINLSGSIPPEEGQENILRLWLAYRGEHPRLDVLVREWLCDYSLLHRLPPPALPHELYGELLSGCRLKEFYVSGWQNTGEEVLAILLFCNNYDYKKSKFYRADTAKVYDRVLSGAVAVALAFLREKNADTASTSGVSTITRDAFAGAICSYRLKRRIEVDYASFSHTHELRYIMTDVLKYAENAIRATLSVKSRLTVYQIGTELRQVLDDYLAEALPKKSVIHNAKNAVPEYEKRYDIPVRPVSPERAAKIEADSWETTKKLVEAFGQNPENDDGAALPAGEKPVASSPVPDRQNFLDSETDKALFSSRMGTNSEIPVKEAQRKVKEVPEPDRQGIPPGPGENDSPATLSEALGNLAEFVRLAAAGDRLGERRFASDAGMMPDAIADKINTIAGDIFGDIILEDSDGCYTVIEDYREDLRRERILV